MNKRVKQFALAAIALTGALKGLEYCEENKQAPPRIKVEKIKRILPTRTFSRAVETVIDEEDTGLEGSDSITSSYNSCLRTHAQAFYENDSISLGCNVFAKKDECDILDQLISQKIKELKEDPTYINICWDVAARYAFAWNDPRVKMIKQTLVENGVNITLSSIDSYGRLDMIKGKMSDTGLGVECTFSGLNFICAQTSQYVDGYFMAPVNPHGIILFSDEEGIIDASFDSFSQDCVISVVSDFLVPVEPDCDNMMERFPNCEYPPSCYGDGEIENSGDTGDTGWQYEDTGFQSLYDKLDSSGDYSDMGI